MFSSLAAGRPPEILEPLLDMEIIAPEEAHLECDIDLGDPPAKLIWYKDNKEVRPVRCCTKAWITQGAAAHSANGTFSIMWTVLLLHACCVNGTHCLAIIVYISCTASCRHYVT